MYKDVAEPARNKFFGIIKQWLEKVSFNFYLDRGPKGEKRGKFPLVQMREKNVNPGASRRG